MATELKLPGLGADDAVVTLLKWHVKPGDAVNAGDLLAELESDKTVVEFEAESAGVINEIRVEEGNESVRAGDVLAIIGDTAEAGAATAAANAAAIATANAASTVATETRAGDADVEPQPVVEEVPAPASRQPAATDDAIPAAVADVDLSNGPTAAPGATALAAAVSRQTDADLDAVSGSGAGGRVTARDLGLNTPTSHVAGPAPASLSPLAERMLEMTGQSATAFTHSGENARLMAGDIGIAFASGARGGRSPSASTPSQSSEVDVADLDAISAPYTDESASAVRKATARRLRQSKREAPHYYMSVDMCVDALIEWRTTLNESRSDETRISINDLMIKMVAGALKQEPALNVLWTGDAIRQFERVDLAVAVATDRGLITPVVRGADQLNIDDIHASVAELVSAAAAGKLKTSDMTGGTFTISNLGMFGVSEFSAIINPPQAAILAIAGTRLVAVPVDASPDSGTVNRSMMTCTLSVDHRAADGVDGARFLNVLKRIVEDPRRLLL